MKVVDMLSSNTMQERKRHYLIELRLLCLVAFNFSSISLIISVPFGCLTINVSRKLDFRNICIQISFQIHALNFFFKKCTCTQFDSQNVISYQKNLWIGFGFIKFITHSDMLIARKMKPIVRSGNRTQANKWNGFCIQSIRKMNSNCNSFACHIQFRRMQSNKTDTL